jgi:hypothetical protein
LHLNQKSFTMTEQNLIDIIKDLKNNLPNDIARRALKGKVENELRDTIVDQINIIHNPPFFAKRTIIDVAVFDGTFPDLLIELKAHNTIDFPGWLIKPNIKKPQNGHPMVHDINKLLAAAQPNTKLYFIFFNNVVKSTNPFPTIPSIADIFGYRHLLKKLFHLEYKDKVLKVFKNWAYLLKQLGLPLNLTTAIEIEAGQYMGFPVSIIAFVYGPFYKNNPDVLASQVVNLPVDREFDYPTFDQSEFDDIKLDGIDFHYEDIVLEDLGNGMNCIPITNKNN